MGCMIPSVKGYLAKRSYLWDTCDKTSKPEIGSEV